MIQKNSSVNDWLLRCLLLFYVFWKVPIVALYFNTYLAMLALVFLFVLLITRGSNFAHHASAMFAAANIYLVIFSLEEIFTDSPLLYALWAIFLEYMPMLLGALLIYHKINRQIKILVPTVIVLYMITSLTTYRGLSDFPMASRELATGSVDYAKYYAKNIGGYNFIYSLVVLHPVFVCVLRMKGRRLLAVGVSLIIGLCIAESKYTLAALTFFISCAAYLIPIKGQQGMSRNRKIVLAAIALVVYWSAPSILRWLAEWDILSDSSEKLLDIAAVLGGGEASVDDIVNRSMVYERSWEMFKYSPVFGMRLYGDYKTGGHSFILDTMAQWGSLGAMAIVFIVTKIAKYYKIIASRPGVYLSSVLSLLLAVVLSIMNTHFWSYELGFIVPICIYYANCLSEEDQTFA